MDQSVVIVCEDLFGLEVYSILKEINEFVRREKILHDTYNIVGFLSSVNNPFGSIEMNIPVWTDVDDIGFKDKTSYVMGIKNPLNKKEHAERLKKKGADFLTVLTPWTLTPYHMSIGEGCVISNYSFKDGAVFEPFVTMINVMSGAAHVGAYTTIDALANITNAEIGECVYIGSHAFLMEHKTIGTGAYIYPGSMVYADVKEDFKMAGIPANKTKFRKITEANASD